MKNNREKKPNSVGCITNEKKIIMWTTIPHRDTHNARQSTFCSTNHKTQYAICILCGIIVVKRKKYINQKINKMEQEK